MHTWVCGGDAAFCQITLETRYFVVFINYVLLFLFFVLVNANITSMQPHCMRLNISTDSHVPPHSCLNSPKHAEFLRKTAILSDQSINQSIFICSKCPEIHIKAFQMRAGQQG